jgi:PAS domain S-box-containing protein
MFLVFVSMPFMVLAALAEEHEEAAHVIRESEERFRLVANTAPVMIWMAGTDRLCTYVNQPWLEFTGRPLEAQLGNGWAEGVHNEDLKRCLETYSRAFDQRQSFAMEYRIRRNDGEYRWILDTGVPRFNANGSLAGYIGSCANEISLCLFRVLQEALQNAVKHSAGQNFTVEVHGTEKGITLTVSDSGIGFDWQHAMNGRGLGLISMRERLRLVNRELSIQSAPGRGTTVIARVPHKHEDNAIAIAG